MNTIPDVVRSLSLENAKAIAIFSSCGDLDNKYQNDAANLPSFDIVKHLFTEPGGGPFVLPEGWDINNLGPFGTGFVERGQALDKKLPTLTIRPNQRMNTENLLSFRQSTVHKGMNTL